MEIETKRASLDTLSVTIQALHVNGKQMTLAVFRQLPETRAFARDGGLAPLEYWGLVRYYIKDEGSLWVVCSKDGILYRCPPVWEGSDTSSANAWMRAHVEAVAWWHAVKAAKAEDKPRWDWPTKPYFLNEWSEDQLPYIEAELAKAHKLALAAHLAVETRKKLEALPQLFIAV